MHECMRWYRHCRTLRSSSGRRRWSPAGDGRRTRSRPPPPDTHTDTQSALRKEATGQQQHRTWCALQMRSRSCLRRNCATTSSPKVNDTPGTHIHTYVIPSRRESGRRTHLCRSRPSPRCPCPGPPKAGRTAARCRVCLRTQQSSGQTLTYSTIP